MASVPAFFYPKSHDSQVSILFDLGLTSPVPVLFNLRLFFFLNHADNPFSNNQTNHWFQDFSLSVPWYCYHNQMAKWEYCNSIWTQTRHKWLRGKSPTLFQQAQTHCNQLKMVRSPHQLLFPRQTFEVVVNTDLSLRRPAVSDAHFTWQYICQPCALLHTSIHSTTSCSCKLFVSDLSSIFPGAQRIFFEFSVINTHYSSVCLATKPVREFHKHFSNSSVVKKQKQNLNKTKTLCQ